MSQLIYVFSGVVFFLLIIFFQTLNGVDHVVRDDD